jgi:hypothetical protein
MGDVVEGDVEAVLGEDFAGRLQDLRAIPQRVGAQRTLRPLGNGGHDADHTRINGESSSTYGSLRRKR